MDSVIKVDRPQISIGAHFLIGSYIKLCGLHVGLGKPQSHKLITTAAYSLVISCLIGLTSSAWHNKHSRNISGVHSFLSLTVKHQPAIP